MVLFHCLQIPCVFSLLGVEGKEDGRDGAEETHPTATPEHHATGYDGVEKAVIARAIAACVDSRGGYRRLMCHHRDIARSCRHCAVVPLVPQLSQLTCVGLLKVVPLAFRLGIYKHCPGCMNIARV